LGGSRRPVSFGPGRARDRSELCAERLPCAPDRRLTDATASTDDHHLQPEGHARRRRNHLPSYYRDHTASDFGRDRQYVRHRDAPFSRHLPEILLEHANDVEEVQHPIIREVLRKVGQDASNRDYDARRHSRGHGLGSSGSFTTALPERSRIAGGYSMPASSPRWPATSR
jgi:hypothetical protein